MHQLGGQVNNHHPLKIQMNRLFIPLAGALAQVNEQRPQFD